MRKPRAWMLGTLVLAACGGGGKLPAQAPPPANQATVTAPVDEPKPAGAPFQMGKEPYRMGKALPTPATATHCTDETPDAPLAIRLAFALTTVGGEVFAVVDPDEAGPLDIRRLSGATTGQVALAMPAKASARMVWAAPLPDGAQAMLVAVIPEGKDVPASYALVRITNGVAAPAVPLAVPTWPTTGGRLFVRGDRAVVTLLDPSVPVDAPPEKNKARMIVLDARGKALAAENLVGAEVFDGPGATLLVETQTATGRALRVYDVARRAWRGPAVSQTLDVVSTAAMAGGDQLVLAREAGPDARPAALHLGRVTATGAIGPWAPVGVKAYAGLLVARSSSTLLAFSEEAGRGTIETRLGRVQATGEVALDEAPLFEAGPGLLGFALNEHVFLYGGTFTQLRCPML